MMATPQCAHAPRPRAPLTFTAARRGLLQRKCACGGTPGADGECEECKNKQLQRKAAAPKAAAQTGAIAPPIVHEVLRSPGQPLDSATRAFMEPRFGHDFSQVRVHTNTRAAESARAVNALAYTVGSNVVFGSGQYGASSREARRLLAHELAHTLQSGFTDPGDRPLRITGVNEASERQADLAADAIGDGEAFARVESRNLDGLARARDPQSKTDAGTTDAGVFATAPVPGPTFVCGPDVTAQLKSAVAGLRSMYAGWSANQKEEACWALENTECGPDAWDVVQLHNNAWIYQNYRPACASAGATPLCGSSVQVGSDCHNAGSANYVIFGTMCSLCNIWKATMHAAILAHKIHLTGLDADYGAAVAWADAGYSGWPGAATPAGDRNNCQPKCAAPYSGKFDVHWYPSSPLETVGSSCPVALRDHRVMRDSPPPPMAGGF